MLHQGYDHETPGLVGSPLLCTNKSLLPQGPWKKLMTFDTKDSLLFD